MKEKLEGEQQPLAEDIFTIEQNINNLRSKADELKVFIEGGFDTLKNLELELGTYKMTINLKSFVYYF
jgi:uncharacterized protein YaaN involved in tellurite resistance